MQLPTQFRSLTGFARLLPALAVLALMAVSAAPAGQQGCILRNETRTRDPQLVRASHDSAVTLRYKKGKAWAIFE